MAESLVGSWILQPQFDQIAQPLLLQVNRTSVTWAGFNTSLAHCESENLLWMFFTYSQMSMIFNDDDNDDDDGDDSKGIMGRHHVKMILPLLPLSPSLFMFFKLAYTLEIFIIRV